MLTSQHVKAARAILGWNIDDLAEHSKLSRSTIWQIESANRDTRVSSLHRLQETFEKAGVEFETRAIRW